MIKKDSSSKWYNPIWKVYKCKYCPKTSEDLSKESLNEMSKHENNCVYNPELQNCLTCSNRFYDKFDDCHVCKIDMSTLFRGNCKDWKLKQ